MNKKVFTLAIALTVLTAIYSFKVVIKDQYLPFYTRGSQIISHDHYALKLNPESKQADWVSYRLQSNYLRSVAKRKNNFKADPLASGNVATVKDYKGSGYDRGHLCPAAAMAFKQKAMDQTFYMTNMSPQLPGFNRGIWKRLEAHVRKLTSEKKRLFVTTGAVIGESEINIGVNRVPVPTYFYKALMYITESNTETVAYLMKHESLRGDLMEYVITIDSLERFTGEDFFHALPNEIENITEAKVNKPFWMVYEE